MAQAVFALGEQNNSLSMLQKAEKFMEQCTKSSNQKPVLEFYEKVKARCALERAKSTPQAEEFKSERPKPVIEPEVEQKPASSAPMSKREKLLAGMKLDEEPNK